MKSKTPVAIAAALLCAASLAATLGATLATTAFAQEETRDGERRLDREDQQRPAAERARRFERGSARAAGPRGRRRNDPARIIDRLDTDADGLLDYEEFSANRLDQVDRLYDRLDRDDDGAVSLEELDRPARATRGERREANRGRPEIDREALAACIQAAVADAEIPAPRADPRDADRDGDGLELAELEAALEARNRTSFERLDADGDGLLSLEELQARRAEQRELRAARRDCVREALADANAD